MYFNQKSKIKNLKLVGIVALGVTFSMCGAVAQAQQAKKVYRIGHLATQSRISRVEKAYLCRK